MLRELCSAYGPDTLGEALAVAYNIQNIKHLQLCNAILQVWLSMGNLDNFMSQERTKLSL